MRDSDDDLYEDLVLIEEVRNAAQNHACTMIHVDHPDPEQLQIMIAGLLLTRADGLTSTSPDIETK